MEGQHTHDFQANCTVEISSIWLNIGVMVA